jgi:hypothetical protein
MAAAPAGCALVRVDKAQNPGPLGMVWAVPGPGGVVLALRKTRGSKLVKTRSHWISLSYSWPFLERFAGDVN